MSEPVLAFRVHGSPQPAGSKKAFVHPATGHAQVVDANSKARPWKERVAQVAGETYSGPLLDGPLVARFTFFTPRPRGHFGTGRNAGTLKPSAPAFPTTRPDALKLARAVEDALTGVVWRDDALIVEEHLYKRYGNAGCQVEISAVEASTVELAMAA